jgi:hypothetical protein
MHVSVLGQSMLSWTKAKSALSVCWVRHLRVLVYTIPTSVHVSPSPVSIAGSGLWANIHRIVTWETWAIINTDLLQTQSRCEIMSWSLWPHRSLTVWCHSGRHHCDITVTQLWWGQSNKITMTSPWGHTVISFCEITVRSLWAQSTRGHCGELNWKWGFHCNRTGSHFEQVEVSAEQTHKFVISTTSNSRSTLYNGKSSVLV